MLGDFLELECGPGSKDASVTNVRVNALTVSKSDQKSVTSSQFVCNKGVARECDVLERDVSINARRTGQSRRRMTL